MGLLERYGADRERVKEAKASGKFVLGRIVCQGKRVYRMVTDDGEFMGEVSGKFRHAAHGTCDYPAVGDYVLAVVSKSTGKGVIHQLLTRRTKFERRIDGNAKTSIQVVATNIDVVFVCVSLNANFNLSRLERYLSVAWKSGAKPVILLTKGDLMNEGLDDILEQVRDISHGAEVVVTSSGWQESPEKLRKFVPLGVTAAFVGSSGVGKSTLVNLLVGENVQATAEIRESDDKGRHTTSVREMIGIPGGGMVIDTPGMRELGVETVDLASSFKDIEELALYCRFSDCRHQTEPDCAVRQAVEDGELDPRRLENYLKLRSEFNGHY